MNIETRQISRVFEQLTFEQKRSVLEFAHSLLGSPGRISAKTAQQTASAWLVSEVGNLLMGGTPVYLPGERPVWRVPVLAYGRQEVAFVDVDAQTGQLPANDRTPARIIQNARVLAHSSLS